MNPATGGYTLVMRLLDLLVRLGARPSWARGRLAYRMLQTIVVAQGSSR